MWRRARAGSTASRAAPSRSTEVRVPALLWDVQAEHLGEAEYFFEHGFDDLFYAVGIVPAKLPHVDALAARGASLKIVTDNTDVAGAIASFAPGAHAPIEVYIEIDSGDGRAGVIDDRPAVP